MCLPIMTCVGKGLSARAAALPPSSVCQLFISQLLYQSGGMKIQLEGRGKLENVKNISGDSSSSLPPDIFTDPVIMLSLHWACWPLSV